MPNMLLAKLSEAAFVCALMVTSQASASPKQNTEASASHRFEDYFSRLNTGQKAESRKLEAVYEQLIEATQTMAPAEIAAGLTILDEQLDSVAQAQDPYAKGQAVYLMKFIGGRQDGPELLSSQLDRLKFMLNDPEHHLTAPALVTLQMIGYRRPEVVWPILEAALKEPAVNNATGYGPGIAVVLLRMGPHGDDVTEHVAQYMHRADLTDDQLLDTIIGIDSSSYIPDILARELVHSLDRQNERIKVRALVGLARSTPAAREAARVRIEKMANDPSETANTKHIAAEALKGEVTEDPESSD